MSDETVIKVFGHQLHENTTPKLYKLGKNDYKRLKVVLLVVRDQCADKDLLAVARKVESSKEIEFSGLKIGIIDYPAIYCWYVNKPKEFMLFFEDTVEKMWAGDKTNALKMLERFFEKQFTLSNGNGLD